MLKLNTFISIIGFEVNFSKLIGYVFFFSIEFKKAAHFSGGAVMDTARGWGR